MTRDVFGGPFRIRDMRYGAGETHVRHAHDELQISFLLHGTMCEQTNGIAYRGRAGDIIVKPGGVMHSDWYEATRIVCIDTDPHSLDIPLDGYGWHRAPAATAAALRLTKCFLAGEDPAGDLADLLGMLWSRPIADRRVAMSAARFLDDAFVDPPSVEELASQLGVHRVYLARVFRLQWGCSPSEYVQQLRVRAAAHDLASTMRPIADIALENGFSDQAHLGRLFLRHVGITRAAFRRIAR